MRQTFYLPASSSFPTPLRSEGTCLEERACWVHWGSEWERPGLLALLPGGNGLGALQCLLAWELSRWFHLTPLLRQGGR